jgi:hypothetical protein
MLHRVFVPIQAVGASLVYFDLFAPAGSDKRFELVSCQPIVSGSVAVTGVLGVDLYLTRTTAVGTGGTAMTYEGTSLTAMTVACQDGTQTLSTTDLSGRLTPTGGATAGAVLDWRSVFTEETNSAPYNLVSDMARNFYPDLNGILIPSGTGLRIVQGSVASVGNIGFDLLLRSTMGRTN